MNQANTPKLETVYLELTRRCNLRCIHCSNSSGSPLNNELTQDEVIDLINQLRSMSVKDLRIYGGEPLLRDDLFAIASYAKDYNMDVSIYTNGLLIDEKIIDSLKQVSMSRVLVGLDGSEKKHDRIRSKQGSYEKTTAAIKSLVSNGFVVDVFFTVSKINSDEIMKTFEHCAALGVRSVKSNIVSKTGRAKKNWHLLSLTPAKIRSSVLTIGNAHQQYFGSIKKRGVCGAGITEIMIAANGSIYPCPLLVESTFCSGNLRNNSLNEIWNDPQGLLSTLRNILIEGSYCGKCNKKAECGGGCRARALLQNEPVDLLSTDLASCTFWKTKESPIQRQ